MGSPDARQIDGIGGGHPLTSKVAIISKSQHADCDVDYLFLQVTPDSGAVSDSQNCGNMLAAVGPFAVERECTLVDNGMPSVLMRASDFDLTGYDPQSASSRWRSSRGF